MIAGRVVRAAHGDGGRYRPCPVQGEPVGQRPLARSSTSFSAICFLESSGSGGFTVSAIPCGDGVAWIPLGQETLGESGTMS
jgi:hypothetical protein